MTENEAQLRYGTCPLCEAICGIRVEVEGDRIRAIRGDDDDPFSRGYICPKAAALQDLHEDPDRLRFPMRRVGDAWQRVPWDEALDEAASRLRDVQRAHGRDAVAVYMGNPTVHSLGSMLFGPALARSLRTRNKFSATSVDQLPHHVASLLLFGHQLLLPIPDVDRASLLVVMGANPVVSNGSLLTAPGMPRRLKALRARGGRIVVVDPRRTETADIADEHRFIRPGTDVWMLLAIVHVLFAERLTRPGRLAAFVDGVDRVARAVRPFTPERAAEQTGVDAAEIVRLSRAIAASPGAAIYGRFGLSTQPFGGLCQWLIQVIHVLTGNLDRAGGAMFTKPAIDVLRLLGRSGQGHFDKRRSRVRGLPESGGEFPVATLADEILTPGEGQVRALVVSAGNPVLSTPNGRRLDEALAQLDFMVAIDFFRNESTRHAHLVLPPSGPLERDHYDLIFHVLAARNTAKWSPAVFPLAEGARHDWQIFLDLARRIAPGGNPLEKAWIHAKTETLLRVGPRPLIDLALRVGPYGTARAGLSLKVLQASPHGIDLGALAPCLPERLFTKDKRIQLAPEVFIADLDRVARSEVPRSATSPDASLLLVGRRQLRSNNSWLHNAHRLVKGPQRCTALMHPTNAAERGLRHGERVRVASSVGHIDLPLEVTEDVMEGTISIPHGWGHDRPGIALRVAAAHPGASLNDLTEERALDALTGNAAFSGVAVRVAAVRAEAPAPDTA